MELIKAVSAATLVIRQNDERGRKAFCETIETRLCLPTTAYRAHVMDGPHMVFFKYGFWKAIVRAGIIYLLKHKYLFNRNRDQSN